MSNESTEGIGLAVGATYDNAELDDVISDGIRFIPKGWQLM